MKRTLYIKKKKGWYLEKARPLHTGIRERYWMYCFSRDNCVTAGRQFVLPQQPTSFSNNSAAQTLSSHTPTLTRPLVCIPCCMTSPHPDSWPYWFAAVEMLIRSRDHKPVPRGDINTCCIANNCETPWWHKNNILFTHTHTCTHAALCRWHMKCGPWLHPA